MSSAQENMSRRKQSRPKAIKRPDQPPLSQPSLPSSLTIVRHQRQDEELDRPTVVCSSRLEAGTRFGPYDVSLLHDDADSDFMVKISSADLHHRKFTIRSQDGDWLSLIRLQDEPANSIMTARDSKIWLEIGAQLEPETELVASTCLIKSETVEETDAPVVAVKTEVEEDKPEVDTETPPSGEIESRMYVCPHCAVRFSSVGTLEAHVTHYCRKVEDVMSHVVMTTGERVDMDVEVDDDSHQPMKKRRRFSNVAYHEPKLPVKEEEEDPTKPFRCPHCSFVSAKRTNLHCHMRNMHRNPYKSQDGGDDEITMPELYCIDCKIQFSATKTYTAHKTYYCGRRKSESDEYRSTPISLTHISALTSLTPPVFVTPMLLANGTPMPILMQPVFLPLEEKKEHATDAKLTQEQPLDLTVKKSPTTLDKNQNDIKKTEVTDEDKARVDDLQVDQIDGRQAYNICSSCKIVFYKYENFMIHKQYYCRGRQEEQNGGEEEEKGESPLTVACGPCNITFKSQVTLEAHQQYYCPHRERKEPRESEEEEGQSLYVCRKCGREYSTPKLFRMHFCDKGKQATETWSLHRCTRCNFVTHKETAFVEHMRKHAAINGYRCQLCGYKGNTVRGMRMHGKMMHPELGDNFMDAQVVELHKFPNDITEQKVDPDLESEIIRLKSEPYKRRRSKYHRQAAPPSGETVEAVTFKCNVCEVTFTGSSDEHVREYHSKRSSPREFRLSVKEEVEEKEETEEELLDPVTVDDELVPSPPTRGPTPDQPHSPKPTTSRVQLAIPKVEIKNETVNSVVPTTVTMETDSEPTIKELSSGRHCDDCNITFKFSHSYSAHKKYYCSARTFSAPRDVTFSPPLATAD